MFTSTQNQEEQRLRLLPEVQDGETYWHCCSLRRNPRVAISVYPNLSKSPRRKWALCTIFLTQRNLLSIRNRINRRGKGLTDHMLGEQVALVHHAIHNSQQHVVRACEHAKTSSCGPNGCGRTGTCSQRVPCRAVAAAVGRAAGGCAQQRSRASRTSHGALSQASSVPHAQIPKK